MQNSRKTLVEEALAYAEMGWHVFPVREKYGGYYLTKDGEKVELVEKSPYISSGLHKASTDKIQIKNWWAKHPNAAIGVNCKLSNLFVVDIDVKKGDGSKEWDNLKISSRGAWISITGSGGFHIIYSGHGRSSQDVKLRPNVDTRGDGGYFIAPNSFIENRETKERMYYRKVGVWNGLPAPIPDGALGKLGLIRKAYKSKPRKNFESGDEELLKAKETLEKTDSNVGYSNWIAVGMYLKQFGDDGFALWESFSEPYFEENPKGRETARMNYHWARFWDVSSYTIATLEHFQREYPLEE